MPWKSTPPDPLDAKRRELEQRQRLLAERQRKLTEALHGSGSASAAKSAEPPVWRMEDDVSRARAVESSARKRQLARQRRRDMILFFLFIGVLILVVAVVWWVAYVHNTAPSSGA